MADIAELAGSCCVNPLSPKGEEEMLLASMPESSQSKGGEPPAKAKNGKAGRPMAEPIVWGEVYQGGLKKPLKLPAVPGW